MGAVSRRQGGVALVLALLGAALLPCGRCVVTPYDLAYNDDGGYSCAVLHRCSVLPAGAALCCLLLCRLVGGPPIWNTWETCFVPQGLKIGYALLH